MKKLLITGLALFALTVGLAVFMPELAAAAPKDEICQGVGAIAEGGCDPDAGTSIDSIIKFIINIFSAIIGIVAVIMFIVAGAKLVGSGGDSGKVASAKSTLIYAALGLVVVAMAQSIVWFVLNKALGEKDKKEGGTPTTTYIVPTPSYYAIEFNNKTVL